MANNKPTVFQNLNTMLFGSSISPEMSNYPSYGAIPSDRVLYSTSDKNEYEHKLNQYKQQKMLSYQWVKAGADVAVESLAGYTATKLMYRDADLMDGTPEIGAALDIIAEEACLGGDTKIKLLDNSIHTIQDLYNSGVKNFWCYAVDENGIVKPTQIEGVVNKGIKSTMKIILDDNTEIVCTPDHKWMLSNTEWVNASELKKGDSLMSIYDSKNYLGYEQVKSSVETKKRLTHQIVANEVLHDEKMKLSKNNVPYQQIVIHHNTFDKLNNTPDCLTFMYWNDHQKLHTDLNQARWNNPEFSEKMRHIFSETAKNTWQKVGEEIKAKKSASMKAYISSLSQEDRIKKYGRQGESNGMYGVHRYGSSNPNYDATKKHICDIDENEYVNFAVSYNDNDINNALAVKFNLSISSVIDYNKIICNKYKVKKISCLKFINENLLVSIKNYIKENKKVTYDDLCRIFGYKKSTLITLFKNNNIKFNDLKYKDDWKGVGKDKYIEYLKTVNFNSKLSDILMEHFNISHKRVIKLNDLLTKEFNVKTVQSLKYAILPQLGITNIKSIIMSGKNSRELCTILNISLHELNTICKNNGYKNFRDLKKSLYNHRIKEIIYNYGSKEVFDLKNSSTNNCFGVKCENGLIISHNCNFSSDGAMLSIYSKSARVKAVLEDLFINRLNIHIMLPMICRGMIKYGNQFLLLNIDKSNGIMGWKVLPVYEIDRQENGYINGYATGAAPVTSKDLKPDETRFVWIGHNESMPYKNWQVAHFRLLNDSFFLPYGTSALHKARRAWRMWSMMEDAMLIYRLDKSIERRVFKVYVGTIDDADVPAFVNDVANEFKRTPIIDPATGQVDLRKNFLDVSADYFIPVRDPNAPTPIENLPSADYKTAMDDINYMQNKVFSALRVPKTFLNFQEAQGKGQNLSLLDIRFCRMVNRVQQFLIMELNKVAQLHLYLMGLTDELNNFALSMNNPSAQIEALEMEDLTKRITLAGQALADPGIGMPIMSLHWVLKKVMKLTDSEIKDMLNEIRLEKAMAAELAQTQNIIKKTGIFDTVDRIYGDYDAMNKPDQGNPNQDENGDAAMGGAPAGSGDMGGSLADGSLGGPGDETSGDIGGEEADMDMSQAPNADEGSPVESKRSRKPIINETKKVKTKSFTRQYFDMLAESSKSEGGYINDEDIDFDGKNTFINERIANILETIDNLVTEDKSDNLNDNDASISINDFINGDSIID